MIGTRLVTIPADDAISFPGGRDYTILNFTSASVFYENQSTITTLGSSLSISSSTKGNHTFFAPQPATLLITTDDAA